MPKVSKTKKSPAGRKSLLTPGLSFKIRNQVLQGIEYKSIRQNLGIPEPRWDNWVHYDTNGFRSNLVKWKAERHLELAQEQVPKILSQDRSMGAKTMMTTFILETVGKEQYSKKLPEPIDTSTLTHAQLITRILTGFTAIGITNVDDLRRRISQKRQLESSAFDTAAPQAEGDDYRVRAHTIDAGGQQIG